MVKAELVIESRTLSVDDISRAMERPPDRSSERGTTGLAGTREWSTWALVLNWPELTHGGTDGIGRAILSLGMELARNAGALRATGCDVVLSILQDFEIDWETGLTLSADAIQWLSLARASLSVDQYLPAEK